MPVLPITLPTIENDSEDVSSESALVGSSIDGLGPFSAGVESQGQGLGCVAGHGNMWERCLSKRGKVCKHITNSTSVTTRHSPVGLC